jgi:hypothetical protein
VPTSTQAEIHTQGRHADAPDLSRMKSASTALDESAALQEVSRPSDTVDRKPMLPDSLLPATPLERL